MEAEDIAVKLEAVDSRSRSNTHRIDALERHQAENDKMLNTIALIAQRQDTMDGDIKEIKTDVKSLAAKPDRTLEEDDMLDAVLHGGQWVSGKNLKAVLDWYGAQKERRETP